MNLKIFFSFLVDKLRVSFIYVVNEVILEMVECNEDGYEIKIRLLFEKKLKKEGW